MSVSLTADEDSQKAMSVMINNLSFDKKGGIIKTDFLAQNKLMEADKLHIANVIYNLLDNWTINLDNVSEPQKSNIRLLGISKLLYGDC